MRIIIDIIVLSMCMLLPLTGAIVASSILWNYFKYLFSKLVKMSRESIYKVTEQGWQYCSSCKKDTWHTPKLGLVGSNIRLCTMCNTGNKLNKDEG